HYSPIAETEISLSLHCEFPEGGTQTLTVRLVSDRSGGAGIEISAPIGDTRNVALADALAYNQKAPTGALALNGKSVYLRHMLVIGEVSFESLDRALTYVASEAMRLRRSTAAKPVPPELFGYLAS